MNNRVSPPEIAHLDAFVNPFTGTLVERTRCGICDTRLPLPGDYPMMLDRHEPGAKLYDCTNEPGSTDPKGRPKILQTGIRVLKPVCWAHVG